MMKVLLDMPVSRSLLGVLEAHDHEGVHAHEIGLDRAADQEVLAVARRENRVVITADLDFPRLLALSSAGGPGLILFRGGSYSDSEMCGLLDRVLGEVPPEVLETSICVVDKNASATLGCRSPRIDTPTDQRTVLLATAPGYPAVPCLVPVVLSGILPAVPPACYIQHGRLA